MTDAATFRVGVRLAQANGGGRLTIETGVMVLEPDRPLRSLSRVQRIVHTDQRVMFVKARLVPPWFSTSVVVHDSEASGYAVTWIGARKRLRAALQASGFDVHEITTWFSLGGGRDGLPTPRRGWPTSGPQRVGLSLLAAAGAATAIIVISHSLLFVAFALACVALVIVSLFRV